MKSIHLVSALALVLSVTACSKSGGGSSGLGAVSHKADACPTINGSFSYKTGPNSTTVKDIISTKTQSGMTLSDTDTVYTVDGKSHALQADGTPGIAYVGTCSNNTVSVSVSQNSKSVARLTYSLSDDGNTLTVVTNSVDARVKSEKEVYTRDN